MSHALEEAKTFGRSQSGGPTHPAAPPMTPPFAPSVGEEDVLQRRISRKQWKRKDPQRLLAMATKVDHKTFRLVVLKGLPDDLQGLAKQKRKEYRAKLLADHPQRQSRSDKARGYAQREKAQLLARTLSR